MHDPVVYIGSHVACLYTCYILFSTVQTEQYWTVVSDRSVNIFVVLCDVQNVSNVIILIDTDMGL